MSTAGTWYVANDPNLPAWQVDTLNQLADAGLLYGVPPSVLAGIDQAESSGQGGAVNPEGFGGYFGLGSGTAYPGGTATPAILHGTDPTSFSDQAQIAASEFAALLAKQGGDIYTAEQVYQTGRPSGFGEGDRVLASLGIPGGSGQATPSSSPGVTGTVTTSALGDIAGATAPGLVAGALGLPFFGGASSVVKDVFQVVLTLVFVAGGIGLILLGATRLFPGVTRTVTSVAGNLPKVIPV